jgi:hypothetical protein
MISTYLITALRRLYVDRTFASLICDCSIVRASTSVLHARMHDSAEMHAQTGLNRCY